MAFHDTRFPTDVDYGAVSTPMFNTGIVRLYGGGEQRTVRWNHPIRKYTVSKTTKNQSKADDILQFFHSMYGAAHSFRFKDWADYKARMDSADTLPIISTTTGSALTAVTLVKYYSCGGYTYTRSITKPVNDGTDTSTQTGTVKLYLGAEAPGNLIDTANWAVDFATGIITFDAGYTPGSGVGIYADYEFDVPVRFQDDDLDVLMSHYNWFDMSDIVLLEVRE